MKKRTFFWLSLCMMIVLAGCAWNRSEPDDSNTKIHPGSIAAGTIGEEEPEESGEDAEDVVDTLVQSMSLEEKIYQLFVVAPEKITGADPTLQAGDQTRAALEQYPVGGIMYSAKNLKTPEQVRKMLANTKTYGKTGLFLSVDEEGGNVARVQKTLGTTKFQPMYHYRDMGPDTAYANAKTIAGDISQFGFNQDYAPVADLWTNPENKVISTRALGSDPRKTGELVAAAVRGFQENGVIAAVKHFPGHGDTAQDSHTGAAVTDKTLDQLRQAEFIPFQAGIQAGVSFVMVSHITVKNVDSVPATFSKRLVTEVLRKELKFQGVIITDALEMGAVTQYYTSGDAAVKALQAGVDMLLSPENLGEAVDAVRRAVGDGTLTEERLEESVRRILVVKKQYGLLV